MIRHVLSVVLMTFFGCCALAQGKNAFVSWTKFRQGTDKYSAAFKEVAASGVTPLARCNEHEQEIFHLGKKSVGGKTKLVILKQNEPDEARLTFGAVLTITKEDANSLAASNQSGDLSEPNGAQVQVVYDIKLKTLGLKTKQTEVLTCKKVFGKIMKNYADTSDENAKVFWECGREGYDGKYLLAKLGNEKPKLWIVRSWDISTYEFANINLEKGSLDDKVQMTAVGFNVSAPKKGQSKPSFKKATYYKMKDGKFTEEAVEESAGIPCGQNK